MLLRRAAQLLPRRRPLLGVSLRRWARLCPAVDRMERVRATAGRPNRRRQTSPTHAMQVRWTRVPYTRPTPLSHPPERSHAPTCTRPNHTHMIVICRRTHPSHHHTPTRTCPGVNGHTLTPMAAGCRAQPAGFGSHRCHLRLRGHTLLAADGRRLRRSRSGGSAAAPGLHLEASEARRSLLILASLSSYRTSLGSDRLCSS